MGALPYFHLSYSLFSKFDHQVHRSMSRRLHRTLSLSAVTRLALAFVPLLAVHSPIAKAQEAIVDGVAAVVNGEVVTLSEVTQQVMPREMALRQQAQQTRMPAAELEKAIQEIRLATLNDLIDRKLIVQDFRKKELQLPPYFVEDRVKSIIRDDFAGDRNKFVEALRAEGLTLKKFREKEYDNLIVAAMRNQNVKRAPVISPTRIEEYYAQNKATEFSTPASIKLRMISIDKNTGDPGSTAETQLIVAQEILAKIKGGAEFGRMAKMYSNDSMSEFDGDYGWIDEKTLNEELSKKAFALPAGKVSDVIDFGSSYYILLVEERKPSKTAPLDDVRETIRKKLEEVERRAQERRWLDGLRAKSFIKLY